MNKILSLTLTVLFVFALTAGAVGAFPEDMKVGQKVDEPHPDGTVTRVEFADYGDWQLIMPYRGDFGGGPYLDDGWIMNVWIGTGDNTGNAFVYQFVHETDPKYTGDNPLWGAWDQTLDVGGGKDYKEDSGQR